MKFGKLHDLSGVDFTLPPDPPRTKRVLQRAADSAPQKPRIFLGATGWSNKEWVGTWFPAKTQPQDYLTHYSRIFNTIEFNTTHYRIPDQGLVDRWRDHAAEGFAFCPKVPQTISHHTKLNGEEQTLRFAEVIQGLGTKLGPCFIQLPDHHGPDGIHLIREYLRMWPTELRLNWELRHPDWFGGGAGEQGFDALEGAGHGTVITDVAGRRDVLHMQLTTPVLMLRFVGNGLHPTDYTRSDAWIRRIVEWSKRGLHEAYIFIHQPEMPEVPPFTGYWAKALNEALDLQLQIPQPIPTVVQGSLF